MAQKFKLEIDFDLAEQSQSELATLLHTIARRFDIALDGYVVRKTTDPVPIMDNNHKVVGEWNYE